MFSIRENAAHGCRAGRGTIPHKGSFPDLAREGFRQIESLELTEKLLARGDRVAGTVRKADALDELKAPGRAACAADAGLLS